MERRLFPQRPVPAVWRKHPEPDWAQIHQELQTHRDLTLQLVWQESRENDPAGYGYSRFCDLYRRWLKKLDLVLRQEHRAGEKMFVDYAGATLPIHDPEVDKEIVRLQRDVALLNEDLRALQRSMDERTGAMAALLEQTLGRVNEMHTATAIMQSTFSDRLRQQEKSVSLPVATLGVKLDQVVLAFCSPRAGGRVGLQRARKQGAPDQVLDRQERIARRSARGCRRPSHVSAG